MHAGACGGEKLKACAGGAVLGIFRSRCSKAFAKGTVVYELDNIVQYVTKVLEKYSFGIGPVIGGG